tara:strand:- start:5585 stop:6262 length:678 start_codon:yes stop_codon:yes gene_type:complete
MIIVTGASRGLGNAICNRLISSGKEVLGIARNTSDLSFPSENCDVSDFESLKDIAKQLKSNGKKVEALINAAGIAAMNLAITTPKATTEKIIKTNLMGTIYSTQAFFPLMIREKKGSIINFSTIAVNLSLKGESIYVASKAGVEGFSRAFAREASDFNIRVNCIAPGPIQTDLISGVSEKQINKIILQQMQKKMFEQYDVCDLVEILLDDKSKSLTGEVLNIGGA